MRGPSQRSRWAAFLLMAASGFTGLGYQIVWTQATALSLGHESASVLAVISAFFGGLALGGLTLGARIEQSVHARRWYVACELLVALWSVVVVVAGAPFSHGVLRATGEQPSSVWQWSVAFASTFVLFLPVTGAMGATLPAMERLTAHARPEGRSLAALYASNTLGAVLGVLGTAFWLIPTLGLTRTAGVCSALNVACALLGWACFPKATPSNETPPTPDWTTRSNARPRARRVLVQLAFTGLLGIGYEVLVVRVLSQVTEGTVYTFAILLAVYLLGSAAGAAAYARWRIRGRGAVGVSERLLGALGTACLVGTACSWGAEQLSAWVHAALGNGLATAFAAETALAVVTFAPATIVMGALFSHLAREASAAGVSFGRALGVNMLGAAAAPVIFGVWAVPALGPKLALLLIALGYLASTGPRAWSTSVVWVPAAATLALALVAPPLRFVDIPVGGHVVSYDEGVMAAVSVVEDSEGVARLRIDNRQQEGSSATRRVDARQAWLPLLLHPAPRDALFLGLGTGVTAGSAAEDPTLHVRAVELLPEVIAASKWFIGDAEGRASSRRLEVVAADARRYVRTATRHYDVVVADNFHPARSGSGALYTVEHFAAVRLRLAARGLFCQWLPLHQLDLDTLRSIARSFLTAFPQGWAMIASNSLETPVLGLVGGRDEVRVEPAALRARLAHVASPPLLVELGLQDDLAVLGSAIAGPEALRRWAGDARANTDDRPVVAYGAPRVTYAPSSTPRDRLITLLGELSLAPEELIASPVDPAFADRLQAYWLARNRFVVSGRDVRPSANVASMLAQVREPLLSVLRISPEFRPAYDPLLAMAEALARSDARGARTLLLEMMRIQPARSEARMLLASMGPERASADIVPR